jgi:hypothetical protein
MLLLAELASIGVGTSVALCWALSQTAWTDVWSVLWIDTFLFVVYAFVYAGIARSVSVTLLGRLAEAGRAPVEVSVLVAEYMASPRFDDRLQLMRDSGLVSMEGGLVTLTARGRRVARWTGYATRALDGHLEG